MTRDYFTATVFAGQEDDDKYYGGFRRTHLNVTVSIEEFEHAIEVHPPRGQEAMYLTTAEAGDLIAALQQAIAVIEADR